MKKALIVSIAAAFASSLLPLTPARAADPARTVAVRHGDLDLGSARGQRTLDLRILHAATEVCGTPSAVDRRGVDTAEDCRARTIAEARGQMAQLMAQARRGSSQAVALR